METLFSKVTGEISAFCNFAEISNTFIVMFQKVAFVEVSKSPLLTTVAGLQSTVYSTTKNELSRCFETYRKFPNGVPFVVCVFETPEIVSPVVLSTETGVNLFSTK